MKEYKPSMYNYIMKQKDKDMIIYNTFVGTKSICKVQPENEKVVCDLLEAKRVVKTDNNEIVSLLLEKGFLVAYDLDEKRKRDFFYAQYLNDSILRLVIHTTKACNFRCKYCSLEFENEFLGEEVQNRIIRFVQKNLHRYNRVEISWFGGEPLMNMTAIENISKRVISMCERANKLYYATITTNGFLLTQENVKKLVALNVVHYTVTLDGLSEHHDTLRVLRDGKPTYATILSNLLYMKDYIKSSKLRVFIRVNMTRKMRSSMKNIYSFYNDKFGVDKRFSLFIRAVVDGGGNSIKQLEGNLLTKKETDETMMNLSECSGNDGIGFGSNVSYLEPGGFCCVAMRFGKYTIDVKGNVYKCTTNA